MTLRPQGWRGASVENVTRALRGGRPLGALSYEVTWRENEKRWPGVRGHRALVDAPGSVQMRWPFDGASGTKNEGHFAMRITLQTDGGFAYLPGLAAPVTVDTDAAPSDAIQWQKLIDGAKFWDQPEALPHRATRGREGPQRDQRTYTLTVVEGARRRTIHFSDPVPPELAPIVRELHDHAKRR